MAITPTQVTVGEIFNKKYMVDFYQREYKWNDREQSYKPIKSLLDDIFYRFELCYSSDVDVTEENISKYDWYYLNSFMTNKVGGNTYIVDGQQRLTTLTVLIIKLYRMAKQYGKNIGYQENIRKRICDYDDNGDMVFWVGFSDREKALKNIFDHGSEGINHHAGNMNIAEKNIYEAYAVIDQYLENKTLSEHKYDAFKFYLLQRIVLIEIDVDDSKDVAMAFEVINDRGIPLKAYEILKGKLLGVISKNEVDSYIHYWEDNINVIADEYSESDIDEFLSDYFRAKYADNQVQYRDLDEKKYHKSIYIEELNDKIGFKHDGNKNYKNNVKTFLKNDLTYFGSIYRDICRDYYYDSQNPYILYNGINEQNSQIFLMLSAISFNDEEKEAKYVLVPRLFNRLYTIVCLTDSYKSNSFNADIIEIGYRIRNKSIVEIKMIFEEKLLEIVKREHNRQDLTDPFQYSYFSTRGIDNLGKRFVKYFFAMIEKFIHEETGLSIPTLYEMIQKPSGKNIHHIEHILAQNDTNKALFDTEEDFYEQRNRLGALVLLRGGDNQSSGNEEYKDKLKTYSGNGSLFAQTLTDAFSHSNVEFIRFCKKYDLNFKKYSQYTKESIDDRQQLLYEMAKVIWKVD